MELLEFENLPSTNTPLSAENLNNNFNVLETNIHNIETNVDDLLPLLDKTFTLDTLTAVSGTLSPSAWREIVTTKTITIEPGTYLFIFRGSVSGTTTTLGLGTLRPMINGSEMARQSIPIGNLVVNATVPVFMKFEQEQSITVGLQMYPNVSITSNGGAVYHIKLN